MASGIGLLACLITIVVPHGSLTFADNEIRYENTRKPNNSRSWTYENIQRLELSPTGILIRTYEDIRWQLGRDREYVFRHLAPAETAQLVPFLSTRLDQRFIARVPEAVSSVEWHAPAKMLHRTGGSNGELKIGADRIVFEGPRSRTWRYTDISNVSSSGPFELTLTSFDGEIHFQLKQALTEDRYNELWRRITGIKVFESTLHNHHE